eukprot:6197606-Pleurochrysis_carterae.AAC.3
MIVMHALPCIDQGFGGTALDVHRCSHRASALRLQSAQRMFMDDLFRAQMFLAARNLDLAWRSIQSRHGKSLTLGAIPQLRCAEELHVRSIADAAIFSQATKAAYTLLCARHGLCFCGNAISSPCHVSFRWTSWQMVCCRVHLYQAVPPLARTRPSSFAMKVQ